MTFSEEAITFACHAESLLGIATIPQNPSSTGVVVVVGGPQYRIGSHRQFVSLARALAAAGHAVLRFDYRGMGDSAGMPRDFQLIEADIGAAIGALQARLPQVQQVALWGLCDGASAALLYVQASADPRVSRLCLLNPWVRSDSSLARTQVKHYYGARLLQKSFWLKLLRGEVAKGALRGFFDRLRSSTQRSAKAQSSSPSFQDRMAEGWRRFPGNILLLLSSDDYTAKEFLEYVRRDPAWKGALAHPGLICHELPGADHTLSQKASQQRVEALTLSDGLAPPTVQGDMGRKK